MDELIKKFKKRGSKDLTKKLSNPKTTAEEKEAITSILTGRGVLAPKIEKPKAKATEAKASKKPSTSEDIVVDFLKVGDTAKFIAKSRDENLNKQIEAEVVKIYKCGRTGKDYVRLRANGHTYHKRLNTFTTE